MVSQILPYSLIWQKVLLSLLLRLLRTALQSHPFHSSFEQVFLCIIKAVRKLLKWACQNGRKTSASEFSGTALDEGDVLPADSSFLDEGGLHMMNSDRLAMLEGLQLQGDVKSSVEVLDAFLDGFVNQGSSSMPLYSSVNALPRMCPLFLLSLSCNSKVAPSKCF